MKRFIYLLAIIILFSSCARSFKSINPSTIQQYTQAENSGVELHYKYGYESHDYPVGYIVGPGLAAGNIAVAATANGKLKKELLEFDIIDKTIKPGETVYGIVGIPDTGFAPLRIVLKP